MSVLDALQPWATVEVIAIEEHVDYWDQQGWKDPFSSATWTDRQREYSDTLRSGRLYTPEMVIGGKTEFVGSKAGVAQQEIEKAATEEKTKVEISEVSPVQNKSVAFKVIVQKP